MFSDLLDMTLSYIQYITLLLRLDPDDIPAFYTQPFKVLRYVVLDTSDDVNEGQRYNNYLRVNLPDWLPLDIRLQYVCIAVIGPMVVATLGMLFVYGKPAYIWFVCALGTLFMFLFGFILLANMSTFAVPGAVLPSTSTLGILGGVGLPCFLLILAGGLLGMGRARLRLLRQDAMELDRLVEEERQRRRNQRVTQQMVDREGIDLVAVAAEQVHAQRDKDAIEHTDWGDVLLQGLFSIVLFIGGLILLNAITIDAIAEMQTSKVFEVIGALTMVVWGFVTAWWVLCVFKKGRQLQSTISNFASRRCLGLIVTGCNILYINVVTNFISIMYCVTLECAAGTRTPFAASLFPSLLDAYNDTTSVLSGSAVGCLSCDYEAYTQRCSSDWQRQLCADVVRQRRLVYDPRVQCDNIDAFFKVSGSLIFAVYLIFLPYLQFYMAQFAVQVLKESYPLERRYYDVFSPKEIYFQKVLSSQNNAAFAYRAYKPEFRFYRLSFLLQKVVLGVVGCVMRRGLNHDVAWAGMIFFLVVPLIALSCSLYLQPFSRQVEAYYFVAVQGMVSVCAIVCLVAQQQRPDGIPVAVWIVLLVLLIAVPVCTLVVGNAVTLQEERRWTQLWQQRLVEGVTAAYEDPSQKLNPLVPPSQQPQQHDHLRPNADACTAAAPLCPAVIDHTADNSSRSSSSDSRDEDTTQPSAQYRGQREEEEEEAEAEVVRVRRGQNLAAGVSPLSTSYAETPTRAFDALGLPRTRRRHPSYAGDDDREASMLLLPSPSAAPPPPPPQATSSSPAYTASAQSPRANSATSSPTSFSSPLHRRGRHWSVGRSSARSDDPTLPAGNATTAAFANLRKLRALPGLLQAETWGDSVRLVLELAGRTIAAPFTHLNHRGVVLEESLGADMPSRVRSATGEDSRLSCSLSGIHTARKGKLLKKEKDSGSSEESGQVGGLGGHGEAGDVGIEHEMGGSGQLRSRRGTNDGRNDAAAPLLAGTATLPPYARMVNAGTPRQHRSVPVGFSNSHTDVRQSLSATSYSMPSPPASSAYPTPSPRLRSLSMQSTSLSLPPRNRKLPVTNPLNVGRLNRRVSTSLSPGTSVVSPMLARMGASATALSSPSACVIVPSARELASPMQQQQQLKNKQKNQRGSNCGASNASATSASPRSGYLSETYMAGTISSDAGPPSTISAATATTTPVAAAAFNWDEIDEYADDAAQCFVPALYFTNRARSRWQSGAIRARRGSIVHHPHTNEEGTRPARRRGLSFSITQELREVPLPWKRTEDTTEQYEEEQLQQQTAGVRISPSSFSPQATSESMTDAAARDGVALTGPNPFGGSSAAMNSAPSSHSRPHPSQARRSSSFTLSPSSRSCCGAFRSYCAAMFNWLHNVDNDAAKRGKYMLSFTDVYARRQLYQRLRAVAAAAGASVEEDVLTLPPAQLRRCAYKAFWGSPTDAMLGVVEVPGSMPPWGLFCHAPPPYIPPHAGHDADGQLQHRSMFSLQRQYYAQLAHEQQRAAADAQDHCNSPVKRGKRSGGASSLTTSPAHTTLSAQTGFRFPLPMHPLRAAAYERQAAAVRARGRDGEDQQVLLPLDTELDAFATAADDEDNVDEGVADKEGEDGVENSLGGRTASTQRRECGTLDWLQQWGPVLTELLYEAAMDDNRRAASAQEASAKLLSQGSSRSSSRSSSSSDRAGWAGGSPSTSSTFSSPGSPRQQRDERTAGEGQRERKKKTASKGRSCLCWPWGAQKKAKKQARPRKAAEGASLASPLTAASPQSIAASPLSQVSRSQQSRRSKSRAGPASAATSAAPSLIGEPPALRRHQSTLLTLITGTQASPLRLNDAASRGQPVTSLGRADMGVDAHESDRASFGSGSEASPQNPLAMDTNLRRDGDGGGVGNSSTTTTTSSRDTYGRRKKDWHAGHDAHIPGRDTRDTWEAQLNPLVAASASSRQTTEWFEEVSEGEDVAVEQQQQQQQQQREAPPPGPQDPLIQQLRCLHLVRQRLKESYWEHRDQLTAVQDYIDYEINETMRRVLTFLFIVVGTVATISFTLAILGMMHTLEWHFINGVRRTDDDVRYELAGYASWEAFTENCCCMAATNIAAAYPYYALDVENWVCVNGVTKERIRRDGYDGDVVDGYTVRDLCGMSFKNNCAVTVDGLTQTATLTGCDGTEVSAAAKLRW